MITQLEYRVPDSIFQKLSKEIPEFDRRIDLNKQTGNFFYDKWEILDQFKNTVWEEALKCLPFSVGQARLMKLAPGTAYYSHADIDDRLHLNITGERSFLVDLDKNELHSVGNNGYWYDMNAGIRHSAVNFGNETRVQLVVRKLFLKNVLKHPVSIKISVEIPKHDYRYIFDDVFSPYLNRLIKEGSVDNFAVKGDLVFFDIEEELVEELENLRPEGFKVTVCHQNL